MQICYRVHNVTSYPNRIFCLIYISEKKGNEFYKRQDLSRKDVTTIRLCLITQLLQLFVSISQSACRFFFFTSFLSSILSSFLRHPPISGHYGTAVNVFVRKKRSSYNYTAQLTKISLSPFSFCLPAPWVPIVLSYPLLLLPTLAFSPSPMAMVMSFSPIQRFLKLCVEVDLFLLRRSLCVA